MYSTFISTFLLASSLYLNPSLEIIHKNHLDTMEGRTAFLTEQLIPYVESVQALNQEITDLSELALTLSPTIDEEQIFSLSEQVTEKMEILEKMIPILLTASKIDEDFEQIETLLSNEGELTLQEQEILDRLVLLCNTFNN